MKILEEVDSLWFINSMSTQAHSTSTATDCIEGLNFKLNPETTYVSYDMARLTIYWHDTNVYLFCWPKP